MGTLIDPVFGELNNYEHGWSRPYSISIFGENQDGVIHIETDTELMPKQREVFRAFEQDKERCIGDIENSIYEYYSSILEAKRADFEDAADELMPVVADIAGLGSLVRLEVILISDRNAPDDRQIGFLFHCTWDSDHGVGVELTGNMVTGVGSQDIVL